MNNSQKIVANTLMKGGYLRRWLSVNGTPIYILYNEGGNPILNVRRKSVEKLKWHSEDELFKEDEKGRITFNFQSVRKLDGRKQIKRMYKQKRMKNFEIKTQLSSFDTNGHNTDTIRL